MLPGQFVEVRVDGSPQHLPPPPDLHQPGRLRPQRAVALGGRRRRGHAPLGLAPRGRHAQLRASLGNGFTMPKTPEDKWLLIGGGVGIAPLLYFGQEIVRMGAKPTFLLGARSESDLLELEEFRKLGQVLITTEDGSAGEQGFVTNHSVLQHERFDRISTCGPNPMMKAVARVATELGVRCEASLENMMACGVGACLCCVEKTTEGNLCVCKGGPRLRREETALVGPVFDAKRLLW